MLLPGPAGRIALACGVGAWSGAILGTALGPIVVLPGASAVVLLRLGRRRTAALVVLVACAGAFSGSSAAQRFEATTAAQVPAGPVTVIGRVAEDGYSGRPAILSPEALVEVDSTKPWDGPTLAVDLRPGQTVIAGESVAIEGVARSAPGRVRGDPVAGRIAVHTIERIDGAGPLFAVGNAVRARVVSLTAGDESGVPLLRGFLIGDTSGLTMRDLDALRRSGLTHYVAVSGSNVALFLAGWWVITAPLGLGPKRRFVAGLAGLAVFVVVTRWEGSVLRAATMAGLMLGGAATGIVVDAWMALGTTVTLLIIGTGHLATDVGFQLSVAATAGILLGARLAARRRPRWAWTVLAATASAQLAVLPILLWHFGSVPLLAPLANLLAAPLVSVATIVGAVGVVAGWEPLVAVGGEIAGLVLSLSYLAATWPQLGTGAVLAIGAGSSLALFRRLRPVVAVLMACGAAIVALGAGFPPPGEAAIFLDVGQGDAILLRSQGRVALIDGGHDPLLLGDRLRSHGIGRIDLLVVTHGDADHVGGFEGIFSAHGVGRLWVPAHAEPAGAIGDLIASAAARGVAVDRIEARSPPRRLGRILLRPLGPARRYAADNDGSIVLWVEAERSLLLAGDIESIAQRELPPLRPDVLLVPHHGSATTDPRWLGETIGGTAVVSVGENRYGHPAPEIMSILEEPGVEVLVTAEDGDIVVPLG